MKFKQQLSLFKKVKGNSIKDMFSVASLLTSVTGNWAFGNDKDVTANPEKIDWEAEKEDIFLSCVVI